MSEVSLLIRKQEKKMTEVLDLMQLYMYTLLIKNISKVLVKKTHFTHLEIERLFQIYRWP